MKKCQSCGMPLDKDPQGGGTNADGSKSDKYCSFCYQQGKFNDNFTKASEMQQFVKAKLKEKGVNGLLAWFFSLGIPSLERWKNK